MTTNADACANCSGTGLVAAPLDEPTESIDCPACKGATPRRSYYTSKLYLGALALCSFFGHRFNDSTHCQRCGWNDR